MNWKLPFFLLLFVSPLLLMAQDIMLPYLSAGKYGVADENGKVIIQPKYEAVSTQEGIEAILVRQNGLWGVINAKDEILFPLMIEDVPPSRNAGSILNAPEIINVLAPRNYIESGNKPFTGGHLYEIYDEARQVYYYLNPFKPQANYIAFPVFHKSYSSSAKFSNIRSTGMIKLPISEGRYNFIDTTGRLVLKEDIREGEVVSPFVLAIQNEDKLYGLFDTKGKAITTFDFSYVSSKDNFEFIYAQRGARKSEEKITYSLFDKYGKLLVADFPDKISVEGNSAIIHYDNKVQLIDFNGKNIFENLEGPISSAFPRTDVFLFCQNNLNGIVSEHGEILLSPEYDQLEQTLYGDWLFKKGHSMGVLNNLFRVKWKIDSLDVEAEWNYDAGFILIKKEIEDVHKIGLIDTLGHIILQPEFSTIEAENGAGPILAKKDSLNELFDSHGNSLIPLTDSIIHIVTRSDYIEVPDPKAIYYNLTDERRIHLPQRPQVQVVHKDNKDYLADMSGHRLSQTNYEVIRSLPALQVNRALFIGYKEISSAKDLINERGKSILPEGYNITIPEEFTTTGGLAIIFYQPNEEQPVYSIPGSHVLSGVIDADGNWILPPDSTLKTIVANEFIKVRVAGAEEFNLYDRHGNLIPGGPFNYIPYLLQDKEIPFDRLILGRPKNWKAYHLIQHQYAKAGDYDLNEKSNAMQLMGCIDHTGQIVVPFKYESISEFNFPFTVVYGKEKSGKRFTAIIDIDGNEMMHTDYEYLRILSGDSSLISFRKGGLTGLMDLKGHIIIPPSYAFIDKNKLAEKYILMDSVSTYIANLEDPDQKIKVGPTGNLAFKKEGDLWYAQLDSNKDKNKYYSSFDSTGKLLFSYKGVEFLSFFMNRRLPSGYKSVRDRKDSPAYVVNFRTGIAYKSKE